MDAYRTVVKNAELTFFIRDRAPYENPINTPPHLHPLPELFIVYSGRACLGGDFGTRIITDRDICLIPPRVFHSVTNDESYRRLAIYFVVRKLDGGDSDLYTLFLRALSGTAPIITRLSESFTNIIFEPDTPDHPFRTEKRITTLALIFLEIAERLIAEVLPQSTVSFPKKDAYYQSLIELDQRENDFFYGRTTFSDLARAQFCTPRQLSRMIRAEYGQNLTQLRSETRMRRAEYALKTTGAPLREIAETLGFASQESFAATFKKAFGVPPTVLRKK